MMVAPRTPMSRTGPDRRWRRGRVAAVAFLLLLPGLSWVLWGASSAQADWEVCAPIAPPGASRLEVSTTLRSIRFAFCRVVIDRLEAKLEADSVEGVVLSARARIVDLNPLDIVVQATWRSPGVLAASWRLGPLGLHLSRQLGTAGRMQLSASWAVSDRVLIGSGWAERRTGVGEADGGWIVWTEVLASCRWSGWRAWIGAGEGGISWYHAWSA